MSTSAKPAVTIRQCRHGVMMFPPHDQYVGRSLEVYGEYGEGEVDVFRQMLQPGDVVIEAGANIGSLTLPIAAQVGPQGRVIAIEPQRGIYQILCGNLALNGIDTVDPIRAACGAAVGQTDIPRLPTDANINFGGIHLGTARTYPNDRVQVMPLDALDLPRLNLIKIDVEGQELPTIQGAEKLIARHRPLLYVENDRREQSPHLIAALHQLNYDLWWHLTPLFNPNNFHHNPLNEFGDILSINLLCTPRDRTANIRGLPPVTGPEQWWRDLASA